MKVSDYQLGTHNRCALRRFRNITTTQSKTDQYHKSVLIKKIVKDAMRERWDESRIQQELEKGFKTLCYLTEETAKIHAVDAKNQIMRYVTCETRTPFEAKAKAIDIFGITVSISPDFIFTTADSIEVVKLRCCKPDLTQTGKKKDGGARQSLGLYALYCYGKTLVPGVEGQDP